MSQIDMILKSLAFMHPQLGQDENYVVECRAFVPTSYGPQWEGMAKGGVICGYFNDPVALAAAAVELDAGWKNRGGYVQRPSAIYVTMNPVNPALLGRAFQRFVGDKGCANDKNVSQYVSFYIDIDPERPKETSASEDEKVVAKRLMKEVYEYLRDFHFFPEPMIADSGNGGHLFYRTAFPATPENAEVLKQFLHALSGKFRAVDVGTMGEIAAKVDTSVFNPSRIVKLHGTFARKGDNVASRPHRQSFVAVAPASAGVVKLDALKRVTDAINEELIASGEVDAVAGGGKAGSGKKRAPRDPSKMFSAKPDAWEGGVFNVREYLEEYGVKIVKETVRDDGAVIYGLEKCVFNEEHAGNEAAIIRQVDGPLLYQCFHDSCQNKTWNDARLVISGDDKIGSFVEGGSRPFTFPLITEKGKPYNVMANLKALLVHYGFEVRYNEMTRYEEYHMPGDMWSAADNLSNLCIASIIDRCHAHGLASGNVTDWCQLIAQENAYHPVREWVDGTEWDGVDRVTALADTVTISSPEQQEMWPVYLRKWLLQCAAALYVEEFSCRGVLTFTGEQGVGKTSWFRSLVNGQTKAFRDGLTIDPSNKDTLLVALGHWIVELGEVDAVFRKSDISKLKAFISSPVDQLRKPYSRVTERWQRRTVFGATVNDSQFLVDQTGNTRWWVVEVDNIEWSHGIDVQQLWAQMKHAVLVDGESWFLTPEQNAKLESINGAYRVVDPVEESIMSAYAWHLDRADWTAYRTTTEVLKAVGYEKPSKGDATRIGNFLRRKCGQAARRRINGNLGRYYLMPPESDGLNENQAGGAQRKTQATIHNMFDTHDNGVTL